MVGAGGGPESIFGGTVQHCHEISEKKAGIKTSSKGTRERGPNSEVPQHTGGATQAPPGCGQKTGGKFVFAGESLGGFIRGQ